MINVEPYKSEFVIAVYGPDLNEGLEFAKILKKHGMEAPVFDTAKIFLEWVHVNVPHIVVLMAKEGDLEEQVREIKSISQEILVLTVVSPAMLHSVLSLAAQHLVYDYWLHPLASEVQVRVKMERALDRLLLQYAQEQGSSAEKVQTAARSSAVGSSSAVGYYESLVTLASDFAATYEREPLIRHFVETVSMVLNHVPALFFRWVPGSSSLVLSATSVLPISQYRGLGLQFKDWSRGHAREALMDPEGLVQLRTLMKKVFSKDHFNAYTLTSDGEILGIFVLLDHITGHLEKRFVKGALALLHANVERTDLLLKNHQLNTFDSVTGLHNRRFMQESVEGEISRARRSGSPFSVILLELDRAGELREHLGAGGFDELIRLVAKVLGKMGRANDLLCRVGEGLFADILPHTPLEGALVKAEKLRRLVEGAKFKMLQTYKNSSVTLSLGVSEYPSSSSDSESLMRSADEAVATARRRGGNRVIRAAVPDNFSPDFEPVYVYQKPLDCRRATT